VRENRVITPDIAGNVGVREFIAIVRRKLAEVSWGFLQRSCGWAVALTFRTVASGAILHEHCFAVRRRNRFCWNLLNRGLIGCANDREGAQ
jgi:hypothetical protein